MFALIISEITYGRREGMVFRMSLKSLLEKPQHGMWGLIEVPDAHLLDSRIYLKTNIKASFSFPGYIFLFCKNTKKWHSQFHKITLLPTQIDNMIQQHQPQGYVLCDSVVLLENFELLFSEFSAHLSSTFQKVRQLFALHQKEWWWFKALFVSTFTLLYVCCMYYKIKILWIASQKHGLGQT